MAESAPLGLFEGFGIELEYMLVDAGTLSVVARADELLAAAAGEVTTEYDRGDFAWNNELARHVIEFKTNGPRGRLGDLARGFGGEIDHANALLAGQGLRLMPTGMHPWMDPVADLQLWTHGDQEIYAAFDRIFSCRGHGWANLQSMHVNLPFADDAEFGRLHAAIRFLMPLMPGLCASTPVMDGRVTGVADNRLAVYRNNCARVPSVTGAVVPEAVYTIGAYHDQILARIYRDLEPLDPRGVLREEWINARGAIARFDRMALEIRVLDTQECPRADLAFAQLIVASLRSLCAERWIELPALQAWPTGTLARALGAVIETAEQTPVEDGRYLRALGLRQSAASVHEVWGALAEQAAAAGELEGDAEQVIEHYLGQGSLATRIRSSLPADPGRDDLARVYRRLCECLAAGELYDS